MGVVKALLFQTSLSVIDERNFPNHASAIALAGVAEENLKFLSRHTGANLVLRGQELRVYGQEKPVDRVMKVLRSLKPYWEEAKTISHPDLMTAFQALDTGRMEEYQDLPH